MVKSNVARREAPPSPEVREVHVRPSKLIRKSWEVSEGTRWLALGACEAMWSFGKKYARARRAIVYRHYAMRAGVMDFRDYRQKRETKGG